MQTSIIKENSFPYAEGKAFRKMIPGDDIVVRRRRRSQGQNHGQGNNVLERYGKQGQHQEEEQDQAELLTLWFVRLNNREPNIFVNLEKNAWTI